MEAHHDVAVDCLYQSLCAYFFLIQVALVLCLIAQHTAYDGFAGCIVHWIVKVDITFPHFILCSHVEEAV